jgi:vancomycin resistance protein YoaR
MLKKFTKTFILLVFLFAIFFVSVFIIEFEANYDNKFFKGIVINGQNVGGKSYQEVLNIFQKRADEISKNGITFNIHADKGTKQIIVPMHFDGMTTDRVLEFYSLGKWEQVIDSAYKIGRQGNWWQRVTEQYKAYIGKKVFKFSSIIQKNALESFINNELSLFLKKSLPARFNYLNGKVVLLPEILGEKIDIEDIIKIIDKKLTSFDEQEENFNILLDQPTITQDKMKSFLAFAQSFSEKKIIFIYNGYLWNVKPSIFISWISIDNKNNIIIDREKIEDYFVKEVSLYIDSPMQNSRFAIVNGKLQETVVGKSGNVVDIEKNAENLEKKIRQFYLGEISDAKIVLPMAIKVEEPKITKNTIAKYNIKELVGTATTNFEGGSLDRQHNIETGVSKLDGFLLAPWQEFSAVSVIGQVTEDAGFVKEYVIKEGKTQKELGGGLCQIATTLFRLALNAGLPITERTNHSYVISYYGAGLDATIYGPHPDLRFVNDTGNYLLLQGLVSGNKVTFNFYGVKDGRTVDIGKPVLYNWTIPAPTKYIASWEVPWGKIKCTEIAHNGVTSDVLYSVIYLNGEKKETNFHSIYKPWQKVCLIGMAGRSQ